MKRRSFLGAMLAACVAPAFIKDGIAREVLMPVTRGWKATEGGILVQETGEGGLIRPTCIAIDLMRRTVEAVQWHEGTSNMLLHPRLAERLITGEVDAKTAYLMVRDELRLDPSPAAKRLRSVM